ncbi:MAG: hypothetical protein FJY17_00235 [Bacteroidetes bacterium]|nr:hypothetical protein [Bacteroidota bacterium]
MEQLKENNTPTVDKLSPMDELSQKMFFVDLVRKYKRINLKTKNIYQLQQIAKRASKELPIFLQYIQEELIRRKAVVAK